MQDILASKGAIRKFETKKPLFVCVISYTATCEIPGLTVAGANRELLKYTSAADAEFLYYGYCKCLDVVPATPDGKPTPALITKVALHEARIPLLVVDAGSKVKTCIPCISFGLEPGRNIRKENAMEMSLVERAIEHGKLLGRQLAALSDLVIIGESIPAGTTTALALLTGLGIDAKFKVSSSMPKNPHELKNKVVESAIRRAGRTNSIFEAIANFGDPMMPSVVGIASGVISARGKVMLAGGTQMCAVLAILKHIGSPLTKVCIGTTTYVANDTSADLIGLVRAISKDVQVISCDLHLDETSKPGLQAFANGFVKEGVGAGGASIASMLKSNGKITGKKLSKAIEREYEKSIERK